MIHLDRFRAENALGFREIDVPLANQGLVFLLGENRDVSIGDAEEDLPSNGSGKTSFCELIRHHIHEKTSQGFSKNEIVSIGQAGDTLTEAFLTRPEGRYHTIQARRHSRYQSMLPSGTGVRVEQLNPKRNIWENRTRKVPRGGAKSEAQQQIAELFESTPSQYDSGIYLSQGSSHLLVTGTARDRCQYLSTAFGIDTFDQKIVKVQERLKERKEAFATIDAAEAAVKAARDSAERIQNLDAARSALMADTALAESERQIRELRGLAAAARAQQQGWERRQRATAGAPAQNRTKRPEAELRAALTQLDRSAALLELAQEATLRAEEIDQRLEELNTTLDPDVLEQKLRAARSRAAELQDQARRFRQAAGLRRQLAVLPKPGGEPVDRAADELAEELVRVGTEIRQLQNQRRQLGGIGAQCYACHRDMPPALLHTMQEDVGTQLAGLLEQQTELLRDQETAVAHQQHADTVRRLTQQLTDLAVHTDPTKTLQALQQQIETVEHRQEQAQEAAALRQERQMLRIPEVTLTLEQIQQQRTALLAELRGAAQQQNLVGLPTSPPARPPEFYESQLEYAQQARERLLVLAGSWRRDAVLLLDAQRHLEQQERELQRLAGLRRERFVLTALLKSLRKLRAVRLRGVVRAISEVLPRYTSVMFQEPGLVFRIDEADEYSLDLVALRRTGDQEVTIPANALSGGERRRLSVSLLFTMHDLLNPTKRLDLLILDEVDYGLDASGVRALMRLVEQCRRRYGTVLMTSHRNEIRKAHFDQVWRIIRENGESRIELPKPHASGAANE